MVTEPPAEGELTISVNFWFTATNMLLTPTVPLSPSMVVELSRQLEYLVTDCLRDCAHHVPTFFTAIRMVLEEVSDRAKSSSQSKQRTSTPLTITALAAATASCPRDTSQVVWSGLIEFVLWKLALFVGTRNVRAFIDDLCHTSRFQQLRF